MMGVDGKLALLIAFGLALCSPGTTCAENILVVGDFSSLDPAGGIPAQWQPLTFPSIERHTDYTFIKLDGRTVIRARSAAAASGLTRNITANPVRYPWLTWQWRIDAVPDKGDVTVKQGDDCAARLYVAFEFTARGKTIWERLRYKAACIAAGKPLPGSTLTYVWANKAPPGTIIDSPYTRQSKVVVVQSGKELIGQWLDEKRNIADDYRAAYGYDPPKIMGIAIMTDTDNTGQSATAYYGDIKLEESE